jgi:hypothetical protein
MKKMNGFQTFSRIRVAYVLLELFEQAVCRAAELPAQYDAWYSQRCALNGFQRIVRATRPAAAAAQHSPAPFPLMKKSSVVQALWARALQTKESGGHSRTFLSLYLSYS